MSNEVPSTTATWRTVLLGNHVQFLRRGIHSRADLGTQGPVLNLHYGDIHTAKRAHLDGISFSRFPTLTREQAAGLDMLQDGDLVLADASEDLDGVGKAVEISRLGDRSAVAGMHTIAARLDKATFADGFKAYLQHIPEFKFQIARMAAGTKVYGISRTHVAAVSLAVPPIGEQRAIAEAVSDADALIDSLERLIEKKRLLKQGMMQELLTGRRRLPGFSGAWEPKTLGQICDLTMGSTPSRKEGSLWGGQHTWLSIGDMHGRFVSTSKESITDRAALECRMVPRGTLLMSFKLSIGRLCFAGTDLYTNEAICAFRNLVADARFLYYLLGVTDFSQYGKQAVKGYTLNSASLRAVEVTLPDGAEQSAIADVLWATDDEIDALEARMRSSSLIREAMMQQLLTGRIRLT